MANINDVAKEAGVSSSTVSRVLNGSSKISKETCRRVMEAVRKLDYNGSAGMAENTEISTRTIGLVSSAPIHSHFYFPVLESIFSTADQLGYGILFYKLDTIFGTHLNIDTVKALEGRVDGVIFVGEFSFDKKDIKAISAIKCPVVSVFGNINVPGAIHIKNANEGAAYEATSYLIKLGHRKIAHIMAHKWFTAAVERMNGYIKALEDNNIPVDNGLITTGDFIFNEAYKCSLELLDSRSDFTAVFCFNDMIASAFIRAARDRNVKIPDDVSVVGFDDLAWDNAINVDVPPITTMRQPRKEIGVYAVKVLIDSVRGIEVPGEKVFNPLLIERNSAIPSKTE